MRESILSVLFIYKSKERGEGGKGQKIATEEAQIAPKAEAETQKKQSIGQAPTNHRCMLRQTMGGELRSSLG